MPREPGVAPERRRVDGDELDHGAGRHAAEELGPECGQRRGELDRRRQCWGDREDHVGRLDHGVVGVHPDAADVVLDTAYGGSEPDPITEQARQPRRDLLGSADEAVLLVAAVGADKRVETPAGGEVEQPVQQRELGGLGGEDRLDRQAHQVTPGTRVQVPVYPGLRCPGVQAPGPCRTSRILQVESAGQAFQPRLRDPEVEESQGHPRRDVTGVPTELSRAREQMLARDVGREGADPDLGSHPKDLAMPWSCPLPTELDHLARADRDVQGPPADPVPGLEDHDVHSGTLQPQCAHESGQSCSDDHRVDLHADLLLAMVAGEP